jgi:hypothetical protein
MQVEKEMDRRVYGTGSYFQFPEGLATVVQFFFETLAFPSSSRAGGWGLGVLYVLY